MRPLKFLRNSAGISMVEVMMAVSVMGGLSLTVAQLMKNTSENTKQNEAKQENVSLKGLIQNNLSVPQACKNTFNALITQTNLAAMTGTGTVAVPNIRNKVGTGTIMYSSTTNLQPLSITTMVLTNYVAAAGTADLVVNSTFKKSTNNIVMVKPIKIPINFNIDNTVPASPVLVNCSSMAVSGGEWMLGGNAGTVDGTDYLGTSDAQPLNFKVNNQSAGRIDSNGHLVALGYQAGGTNRVNQMANTALGFNALQNAAYGDSNTAVGYQALKANSASSNNTAIGTQALLSATSGGGSVAVGTSALKSSTSGNGNVAIGLNAMWATTTGSANTAVGTNSLGRNTTGNHNLGIGNSALYFNTTGISNIGLGSSSLQANTTGNDNIALGYAGLYQNTTGTSNISVGTRAAQGNTSASFNTAVGYESLMHNQTGLDNTAMGSHSLQNNRGSYNAGLGRYAGQYNSSGSYNTFLGYQTGSWAANSSGSRNIFIGAFAGNTVPGVTSASNKLYIETTNNATPLISADFSARTVQLSGATTINLPAWSTSLKLPNRGRITTTTALASDAIYIDSRTLFRDGAVGGTGFVGVAGGLGIGSGSYWDGSVIPGQGNVQIEGTVGIGTQTPAYKLDVNGLIRSTGALVISDIRLKKKITPVEDSLERLSRLNAYNYYWKDKEKYGDQKQLGLVAQEVEKVFPEAIQKDKEGMLSVSYTNLVAPVIESIKELYAMIIKLVTSDEKQNIEVKKLKAETLRLKAENEKLKADLKNQNELFDQRIKKIESQISKNK